MFGFIDETWNPVAMKCPYDCYNGGCWATRLKEGKLKETERYRDLGAEPVLIRKELDRKFKPNTFVFVEDMGDLMAPLVPVEWIIEVIKVMKRNPQTKFLLLTKNPNRFLLIAEYLPSNVTLGATIETNRDTTAFSKAPSTRSRFEAMAKLKWTNKLIVHEPICAFDTQELAMWDLAVKPKDIVIGYDNYKNYLPEPSLAQTRQFMDILRAAKLNVIEKTMREAWNEAKGGN
jgi:hypothetical protein